MYDLALKTNGSVPIFLCSFLKKYSISKEAKVIYFIIFI